MKISAFFINHPLVKWILLFFICVLGVFSISNLKRYEFPRIDLKEMHITTVMPGATPKEVELEVTVPLEEELEQISGIKKFSSTSTESLSFIKILLEPEHDNLEKVKQEIRNAVQSASELSKEIKGAPRIAEIHVDFKPIMEIGVSAKNGSLELARKHALLLRRELRQIEDVGRVSKISLPEQEFHILLNKQKMMDKEVSIQEVIQAVQEAKKRLFAGNLRAKGEVQSFITYSEFKTPAEVENIIIRETGITEQEGVVLRIKEVGKVKWALEELNENLRYNGQPGVGLIIVKKAQGDIINVSDQIKAFLVEYQKLNPEIITKVHFDDAFKTKTRLELVSENALFGLALVLVMLMLFLNWQVALWTALGIPISILMAVPLFNLFEISINNLSLCALMITLGILVDEAIVVGESTYTLKEKGYKGRDAALRGIRRVFVPLVFAILTTSLSFVSMFFIPGLVGDFSVEIPIVIMLVLACSFIEGTALLPAHLVHVRLTHRKPPLEKVMQFLRTGYVKILALALKHPLVSWAIVILFFGAGGYLGLKKVNFYLFPTQNASLIWLTGELPTDYSLEQTTEKVKVIEGFLEEFPKGNLSSYRAKAGDRFENRFSFEIRMLPYTQREESMETLKNFLLKKIDETPSLTLTSFDYTVDSGGPPTGKPLELVLLGGEEEVREGAIKKVEADLKALGLTQVNSDLKKGKVEYRIVPLEKTYFAQVTPQSLAGTLRAAFEGVVVSDLKTTTETVDFRIKLDEESKNLRAPLEGILIRNKLGNYLSVSNLVRIEPRKTTMQISHQDGLVANTVSANFDKEKFSAAELYSTLKTKYKTIAEEYPGVKIKVQGEAEESYKTFFSYLIAITFSVLAIYFLLVLQFNHFSQPFMIITSIPFGIVGILLAFWLQDIDLSMLAMLGVLSFGGVVVNNSLIMVAFINRIKKQLQQRLEETGGNYSKADYQAGIQKAIIGGAGERFRAIFLTTLTTMVGVMPTAYGFSGKTDDFLSPMVMSLFWGLAVGSLAAIFVIPLLYQANEKLFSFWANPSKPTAGRVS